MSPLVHLPADSLSEQAHGTAGYPVVAPIDPKWTAVAYAVALAATVAAVLLVALAP
jgi:hypothetical protein